jgi:hypothetical protein
LARKSPQSSEVSAAPGKTTAVVARGYGFVDGDSLWSLILEVREEFLARDPYELDETRRPNSIRLVALDVQESKTTEEQLAVLRDLIDLNPSLIVARNGEDIFQHADSPGTYVDDLVCAVVCQVLDRDQSMRDENARRLALSADSVTEIEE